MSDHPIAHAPLSSLLDAVLESASDAIVVLDTTGSITRWNGAAARLLGDLAAGAPFEPLLGADGQVDLPGLLARVESGESVRVPAMELRRDEGPSVPVTLNLTPTYGDDALVVGACAAIQDRSEVVRAEETLAQERRANGELRERETLKDEFLATVSHELRTPLTSIIGFSGLLGRASPDLMTYVEPIARNGKEMARMIERLLDFTRLQADRIDLQPVSLALAEHVQECINPYVGTEPDQQFVNEVPGDMQLTTDPDALARILGNLIGNASKYSGKCSTIRVLAHLESDGSTVISVTDDGPGIPAEHQERLFERFFQVPGGASRGTGIGLAIVFEYVSRQGGRVWCESAAGTGTAFRVRLPAHSPESPSAQSPHE